MEIPEPVRPALKRAPPRSRHYAGNGRRLEYTPGGLASLPQINAVHTPLHVIH